MSSSTLTPEVLWAQRSSADDATRNYVFVTISVPDIPKEALKLDVQENKISFTGESSSKKAKYAVDLELYAAIDPAESKTHHTGKNVELVLRKKELGEEYWPRLLKDKAKVHFLKTDFDKWVDEDEQDEAADNDDYMTRMGGMPGGMPGGEGGDFGGIDFSKLGAGGDFGGMGGMGGMPGGEDEEMDDDDDEDDEMPGLEGEADKKDEGAADTTAGAKGVVEKVKEVVESATSS